MEHRKPTDEKPLFINAAVMSDSKVDFNIASSLQMGYKWSTVILGHVSGNIKPHDMNNDSFLDDPMMLQFNLANRWLYQADNGVQVRFGVRALQDSRLGGQIMKGMHGENAFYDKDTYQFGPRTADKVYPWGSDIMNRSMNGYLKIGIPLSEDNSQNIAFVGDYSYQDMDSYFGSTKYIADQHSLFGNLLYQNEINESHKFTLGMSATYDRYMEDFRRLVALQDVSDNGLTQMAIGGFFGEYTYHAGDNIQTTQINAVTGAILKNHPKSWFERFNLKGERAKELLKEGGHQGFKEVFHSGDSWGRCSYLSKELVPEKDITVLQMVICGDMEVMAELVYTKDYEISR
jgi:hypothetical protein